MKYDFDQIIERKGTGALKTDALLERFGRDDLTALWVADMDFATPPFIVDALRRRLEHPIFGYTVEPADYRPAIIDWLRSLHGVEVRPEWISFIPGIVKGIGLAINCFLKQDEKVVVMPPVYHPFRIVPEMNGREVVWWPLTEDYRIDFDRMEEIFDPKCRMLILSNPHNPAGIVWRREDLERIAKFCADRGILVLSDEIHSEMVLPWAEKGGIRHVPFYDVSEDARRCSITFAAPSKTFNIAGIVSSYAIVPDKAIRDRYFTFLKANELDEPTLFAPIATIAAYREGEEWRRQMLDYVEGNIDMVEEFCREHFDGKIRVMRPEASFLIWLDCRGLGLSQEDLVGLFRDKALLALNDGAMFGPGGEGFMRLNAGAPRSVLREALLSLSCALKLNDKI
ncbi:MAG: PatB family C-S lyase [Muribaculaceae bacterium]|nr:PatB family C-S lyase [Muribaculaceae bacterium]